MKQPIEFAGIRVGDKVRWEGEDGDTASEFRATVAGSSDVLGPRPGQYYLIEERKPVVDLPEGPTLGWAHYTKDWGTYLAVWRVKGDRIVPNADRWVSGSGAINDELIGFTEAVAVPKAEFEALREMLADWSTGRAVDTAVINSALELLVAVERVSE